MGKKAWGLGPVGWASPWGWGLWGWGPTPVGVKKQPEHAPEKNFLVAKIPLTPGPNKR